MAVADILALWNNAVGNLGVKTSIAALTEQSAEAAACALRYQSVVESVLRVTDWNCVRQTVALTDVTDTITPPDRWAYTYSFPTECLRLWRMETPAGLLWRFPDPYPLGGFELAAAMTTAIPTRYIYANETELTAIYTRYGYDVAHGYYEAIFDPALKEAIGWALAAVIAGPLTGNASIMAQAKGEALRTLGLAREANGNESATNNMDDAPAESLSIRGFDPLSWPVRVNW